MFSPLSKAKTPPVRLIVCWKQDEETDHYGSHRSNRGYEEDLEAEAQRERRIMNAKKVNKTYLYLAECK